MSADDGPDNGPDEPPPDAEPGPWGRPWGWWREIVGFLPPPPRRGRRADTDLAAVVAAILHRESSGCAWRRLPSRFPPWQTVYSYHRRWVKDGTLRRLREAAGRLPAEGLSLDGDPDEPPEPRLE